MAGDESGASTYSWAARDPRARSDGPGALLSLIRSMGGATRRDLLEATNLARATIESRLDTLLSRGFVVARSAPSASGRPPQVFHVNDSGGYVACVDMGSTQTRLGFTDLGARLVAHRSVDLDLSMGPGVALGKVGTLLREMIRKERIAPALVMGLGVGVPSHVELSGRMARAPFDGQSAVLTPWTDMVIAQEIRAFLPALGIGAVPVVVDKDANIMALGEWRQTWPEVRDLIVMKVGTSISCGIVANSDIVRGAIGMAGDLGHIPDPTSEVICYCGQRGCAEAVASGRAIAGQLGASAGPIHTSKDLVGLLNSGREDISDLMRQSGRRLGVLIGTLMATLNPQLVVVGGNLAHGNPLLLDEIRSVALAGVHPLTASSTRIVTSRFSEQGGLYGAAHLVLRRVLDPTHVDVLIATGNRLRVDRAS